MQSRKRLAADRGSNLVTSGLPAVVVMFSDEEWCHVMGGRVTHPALDKVEQLFYIRLLTERTNLSPLNMGGLGDY